MQLLNTVQNEAIVSNVAEIGEFRIRNSAKAFNILSSGLYANKIRAIIRELSCNAVDSHVAAKKAETPFDVHLPTQLEPHFAIRDYGTGLNHNQVVNIYTTYFESTKTNSNDFIGALGLGSKSPFSYTDNFTVTAIKDGVKGIYSAFINDAGIPSIAKMAEEETTEPAGVEVKFSVNDRWDFDQFYTEARHVYKWFKLRPVVSGPEHFTFEDVEYREENVIPGVHINNNSYHRKSTAVMGNIAYPIEVPSGSDLGDVAHLLECGLIMEFAIGELDFQASREGLSYIPETVAAIKRKLEAVNAVLVDKVTAEADTYKNMWERAHYLVRTGDIPLYKAAVTKYVTDCNFPLIVTACGIRHVGLKFKAEDLAKKYNIVIRAFEKSRGSNTCSTLKEYKDYTLNETLWDITVGRGTHFVVNDTKIGATERAKHHWRYGKVDHTESSHHDVFVLEPANRTQPMKHKAFFKAIHNPPAQRILNASELTKKERSGGSGNGVGKNVTILRMEEKGYGGYYSSKEKVWRDAGKLDSFDDTQTYYYLPLSGFQLADTLPGLSVNDWANLDRTGISGMPKTIYGVRKGDIEAVKAQPNWVNLKDHVADVVAKLTAQDISHVLVKYLDCPRPLQYNEDILKNVNSNSTYVKLVNEMKIDRSREGRYEKLALAHLLNKFNSPLDVEQVMQGFRATLNELNEAYPVLRYLSSASNQEVADYINLVDKSKGV